MDMDTATLHTLIAAAAIGAGFIFAGRTTWTVFRTSRPHPYAVPQIAGAVALSVAVAVALIGPSASRPHATGYAVPPAAFVGAEG